MHNGESAKKHQVSPSTRKECPTKLGVMYLQSKVSHLDENVAALWVWLNSYKSDDLHTNTFSTSTKCKSQGKKSFLLVISVATLQEVRINVHFILISESSPYVLSYRSIYT